MGDEVEEIRVPPVVAPGLPRKVRAVVAAAPPVRREVVAVVVGGWLKDQTARTIQPALAGCGIRTVSPEGWNDWKKDIAGLTRWVMGEARKTGGAGDVRLAMIGHSFGAWAVGEAVCALAREGIYPGYVGLIDPVSPKMGVPQPIVVDVGFCGRGSGVLRVYYRMFPFGPIRANVVDMEGRRVAGLWHGCRRVIGTHNSMCHAGSVVAEIARDVRRLGA